MDRVPTTAGLPRGEASVSGTRGAGDPFHLPFRRLFGLPIGMPAALVLLALVGLAAVAWRGMEGSRPLQTHLDHIARIEDLALSMERTPLEGWAGPESAPRTSTGYDST